jgi:hypothetical protein
MRPRIAFAADFARAFRSRPSATGVTGTISGRFLGVAFETRAIHSRRRQPNRRPGGIRDWSRASINQRRKDLVEFEARWKKLNPAQWPIPKQVDYKLVGSALSRVNWELDINPRWKRDPNFYIEQTLTALAEAPTVPAPYDEARSREILTRIENIPSILQQAQKTPRTRRHRSRTSPFRI